ncbi:unnamed protein product [Rotaria sp. Silwood2]|nr:unnamed protein product [Rotaria sp. Silwood2]CAF2914905.1 unnamed protein product [Rotaria sp. Silwood2]CAF3256999.1 unnamed protein product [Rotaria sp. Silwood2]CAF4183140.1 unnamed protein product [Rotaria sp. Silwood2]
MQMNDSVSLPLFFHIDSLCGDNPDKKKLQTESSTDVCEKKRSENKNHGGAKTGMKNGDSVVGGKMNVTTTELVQELGEDSRNTDEDDVLEEYLDGTNGGLYLLYNKRYEVQECVANVLSYARDHGVLMSGVQLKTLLDIQNVEITKERANGIVQLISTCVDVVTNPHYVAPTSKRPIFEYYGANFKLSEIYPTKSIPIPNEILINYKKSVEITHGDTGHGDNEDIHELVEVNVMKFHGGIDMHSIDYKNKGNKEIEQLNKNNSDNNGTNINVNVATKNNVETCTDAANEEIVNNDMSSFDCLNEVTDGKSDEIFYTDVGSSSTPIKQLDKSFVSTPAPQSSPCAGETFSSITIDTSGQISSQHTASSIDLPEVMKNHEVVKTSSISTSSNINTSTNNPILSINIEDSPIHSTTLEIIYENSSPVEKSILPQLQQKEVIVEQLAADTITSKGNNRKSFGFRPTTKQKRKQLTVAKPSKRKRVDASIHAESSDTTNKKKKLSSPEEWAAKYQALTKSFGKIKKKSNATIRITNSSNDNNKLDD